ncbi:MFS transporter [Ferruginivarius sediminum]|uniref:MFS transporter n=1 Tax=Ferruginivarius sediminum TaxID=2661937 RepID=A0A369TLB5_9PROT|nr:MFS transporter [Ferruginivarius sediminum]RDD63686.1 MFS transporter [Ferruginivarius sediminum]
MPATGLRFAVLNLGHFYTHLFLLLHPTVVLALEREFGGAYGELLLPSTAAFLAFGAATLPAGWLGDRVPREILLAIFFLGLALGAGVTAVAAEARMLTLGLGLIGLFAAIYHPVGIAMVVEGREKVGRALGINGVFGNLGVAAAPLVAGGLAQVYGWRAAFAVPAVVAGMTGVAYGGLLLLARRQGRPAAKPQPTPPAEPLDRAGQWRLIGVLAVAAFAGGLVFHATTVVLPKLFEARLGGGSIDLITVGALAGVVLTGAAFAQIGVGWLIDRRAIKPVFVAVVTVQVPLLLLAGISEGGALVILALFMMASVFGEIPIHDALVARHAASAWRARVYSVKYVVSLGVSALAVPLVAGLHGAGFEMLFAVLAALAAAVAAAALALPRPRTLGAAADVPAD